MNLHELTAHVDNEANAFKLAEKIVWPHGPVCPHCGNDGKKPIYDLSKTRTGLKKCGACRKQFTVRVGTIFEDSHIPLGKWLICIHMMCSSKKGVSAKQLERQLGLSYKSAWFMCHRVRLAMTQPPMDRVKLGGGSVNDIVEIDEVYIGGKARNNMHADHVRKRKPIVMTLIERHGNVRSVPIPEATAFMMRGVALDTVSGNARIVTDAHDGYHGLGKHFRGHGVINKRKDGYVRGIFHTNFAESYHSLLKRGIVGTFHHISEKHLPRYLREFELRWNTRNFTDGERTEKVVREVVGKRLTYRTPVGKSKTLLS